jgi:hypothetical protein
MWILRYHSPRVEKIGEHTENLKQLQEIRLKETLTLIIVVIRSG